MNANTFLVGCDPEFVILNPPSLKRPAETILRSGNSRWGFDHNGWVMELQPEPSTSCRTLIQRMRATLREIYSKAFQGDNWKAPSFLRAPERHISLGGHVHLDVTFPTREAAQPTIAALDRLTNGLEHLDILPKEQSKARREWSGYGMNGDVRWDHGRLEYRSMPSWLFSRKTTLLALASAKFAVLAPEEVPTIDSMNTLQRFIEKFKGKDADADWMLNREYFSRSLQARPDADIKTTWRISEA